MEKCLVFPVVGACCFQDTPFRSFILLFYLSIYSAASRSAGANAPAFKGFSSKRPLSSKFNSSTNNMSTGSMLTSGGSAAAGTPTNGQKGAFIYVLLFFALNDVCLCVIKWERLAVPVYDPKPYFLVSFQQFTLRTFLISITQTTPTQVSHSKSGVPWRPLSAQWATGP